MSVVAPAISADGRFVAFVSRSTNLVPILECSRPAGLSPRPPNRHYHDCVSKDTLGAIGNGVSSVPCDQSPTGRYIAFVSLATNLVTGVTGQQIYLHDRQTGFTATTFGFEGQQSNADIQGNGVSPQATSISSPSKTGGLLPLSRRPRICRTAVRLAVRTDLSFAIFRRLYDESDFRDSNNAAPGNGTAAHRRSARDGRFVAFVSSSTNLVAGVTSGTHVYIRDTQTNQTSLVSHDNSGGLVPGNAPSRHRRQCRRTICGVCVFIDELSSRGDLRDPCIYP